MWYGIGNKSAVPILGSAVYRKYGIVPQLGFCDMQYPCGIAVLGYAVSLRYCGMRYPCSIAVFSVFAVFAVLNYIMKFICQIYN